MLSDDKYNVKLDTYLDYLWQFGSTYSVNVLGNRYRILSFK